MTPFWDELMAPGDERDQFIDALAKKEVPCLFLGSELSSFVTGEIINMGGGLGNIVSQESTFFLLVRMNRLISRV
ncbi:hypothetical protein KFZ58_15060 [Virgibacillus sp. NKC19-16]|uniref:hypothetical protein n=1 Tax=Virgibacillus salidurans TaxID=2831673 RepID=UPI001F2CC08C|nr:hypothetical protein [Virgibacillus sp. NKC19-16]UJL45696.1 hypothetical protein KFZ58_15060 [Virgibacillus sp. NKC19-16]